MPEPLETLAARAADEPFFLAWLLSAYAFSEGMDDKSLAAALGCPAEEMVMLRLCRTPRTDAKEFWDDVSCIAERFGLDPQRLAAVVKRGRRAALPGRGPRRRLADGREGSGGRSGAEGAKGGIMKVPVWVHETAAFFWDAVGVREPFPRLLCEAIHRSPFELTIRNCQGSPRLP